MSALSIEEAEKVCEVASNALREVGVEPHRFYPYPRPEGGFGIGGWVSWSRDDEAAATRAVAVAFVSVLGPSRPMYCLDHGYGDDEEPCTTAGEVLSGRLTCSPVDAAPGGV